MASAIGWAQCSNNQGTSSVSYADTDDCGSRSPENDIEPPPSTEHVPGAAVKRWSDRTPAGPA